MFKTLLIANRGEIACRIIRTAKRLGIKTIAIYSVADARAQHVLQADIAYCVGGAASRESYLNIDNILQVAKMADAEAIHPGYGFLSENAEFAERCEDEGIVFVGPPVSAMLAMSRKDDAKRLLAGKNIPMLPGYHALDQSSHTLQIAADQIGYPILLKAAAGGGGRGMRVVWASDQFIAILESAKREALTSFANSDMIIEKYLEQPRHVEVQIFADQYRNAVYLWDRDCSIQRRHQKVLEEAPAPMLSDPLKKMMGQAAIEVAQTIAYVGAGTIEFLVDGDQYYFMEMNTRLQVEHPVTEMITGIDLVEWQLRIAKGEPLPLTQEQIVLNGHAIELRICAENPDQQFLPASGIIKHWQLPARSDVVRIDSGFVCGDEISIYYDSLLAKLIVWGATRAEAILRLQQALHDWQLIGVENNRDFLWKLLQIPELMQAQINTHFISTHQKLLFKPSEISLPVFAFIAAHYQQQQINAIKQKTTTQNPWFSLNHWQLHLKSTFTLAFMINDERYHISMIQHKNKCTLRVSSDDSDFETPWHYYVNENGYEVYLQDEKYQANVIDCADEWHVYWLGEHFLLKRIPQYITAMHENENDQLLIAPLPGTVTMVWISVGQSVQKGEPLLVVEAMKMEHTIYAPRDGIIEDIHVLAGEVVPEGMVLLALQEALT